MRTRGWRRRASRLPAPTPWDSIRDLLIGADPFRIGELWRTCYVGSAMNGRRGMVIHALGAVEMALWDLCGKAVGLPVHALLGGATRDAITPYASLLPGGDTFAAYRDALCASARSAVDLGFRAVKTEILINGPYAHAGMRESDERHTEVLAAVRETIGLTSRSWSTSAIAGTMPIPAWRRFRIGPNSTASFSRPRSGRTIWTRSPEWPHRPRCRSRRMACHPL